MHIPIYLPTYVRTESLYLNVHIVIPAVTNTNQDTLACSSACCCSVGSGTAPAAAPRGMAPSPECAGSTASSRVILQCK